jgi:beta-barrel assembly-enhancing protease
MRWLLLGSAAVLLCCSSVQSLSHGDVAGAVTNAVNNPNAATLVRDLQKCDQIAALEITFDEERTIGGTVALNWVQLGGGLLVDVPPLPDAVLKTPGVPVPPTPNNQLATYLTLVGTNLALRSSRPTLQWTFGVVDSPTVNAFSAPGGYVFVTKGLLLKVKNEAELAGILAHEIAHVTHKDAFVIYRQTKLDRCKSLAYTKAGGAEASAALSAYSPAFLQSATRALDAYSGGTLNLDNAANQALLTLFSDELVHRYFESGLGRDQELAADTTGLELTVATGYSPRGYVSFVSALPNNGQAFAHHPPPAERVGAMNALLQSKPKDPFSALGGDWSKLPLVPLGSQVAAVH